MKERLIFIKTGSGREFAGKVEGSLREPFLTLQDAAVLIAVNGKLEAIPTGKDPNFYRANIEINTAGAFIIEVSENTLVHQAWRRATSNLVQPKIRIAPGRA